MSHVPGGGGWKPRLVVTMYYVVPRPGLNSPTAPASSPSDSMPEPPGFRVFPDSSVRFPPSESATRAAPLDAFLINRLHSCNCNPSKARNTDQTASTACTLAAKLPTERVRFPLASRQFSSCFLLRSWYLDWEASYASLRWLTNCIAWSTRYWTLIA